uniref:hypothetical protein n=1 Tax=Roseiarcus sp. TaxID=1969460 RepID=UPI003F9CD2BD
MSYCAEAASAAAPHNPLTDARAARLAKFEREQLIVGYLNRGVSVAEIAARMDVSEKRMRAIIRDPRTGIRGLARRMPADSPIRPGGCSWRKMTSRSGPFTARQ